jgi:ubiquinone biosynthesis protein
MALSDFARLLRAGYVLAREGGFSLVDPEFLNAPGRVALRAARLIERPAVRRTGRADRLSRALNRLGPTYVKFGQSLATRPDVVGVAFARDLASLHDAMEPFDPALVPGMLEEALGESAADLEELSPPIAAASIAQVHKARLRTPAGIETVAVKILRPGIEERFKRDLRAYAAGAALAEKLVPATRRFRPTDSVETLRRSAELELDLRLEAASISEFTDNIAEDNGFRVPMVNWEHTRRNVLTTNWLDGIPVHDLEALDKAGVDRKLLAANVIRGFLRHAIRDGFFHADMHPGNLFADPANSDVLAVDFGIMGRINRREQRFLADVVYGFITRDYPRMAKRHFEMGYVPADQSVDDFALALRAIGEPLLGRTAAEISMGRVLSQLLMTTELFAMKARPELILLQKNMVLVEGVARALDPDFDMWAISRPVVEDWLRHNEGPLGRLEAAADRLRDLGNALTRLPGLVERADLALAEYEAEKEFRRPLLPRWMPQMAFWALIALFGAMIWRLVF